MLNIRKTSRRPTQSPWLDAGGRSHERRLGGSTRKADERARDLPNVALLRAHDPREQPAHRESTD